MKFIGVVILVALVSAIISRGPGVPTQDLPTSYTSQPITVTDENNNTITTLTKGESTALNPPHGQPGHRCDIKVGQPLNSKPAALPTTLANPLTANTATDPTKSYAAPFVNPNIKPATNSLSNLIPQTANGLNPPHGQPGHRCDIQVGQPLNSKPLQAGSTNSTISPSTSTTANTAPVATGLNPRHGQPGHRCDIMVGQPLNSKPTLPAVTNNSPSPLVQPTTNSTYVAPGLNPRHGQPGHRCDILVGQPLNSKPASDSTEG